MGHKMTRSNVSWIEIQEMGCPYRPRKSLFASTTAIRLLGDCNILVNIVKTISGFDEGKLLTEIPHKGCLTIEAQRTSVYYASTAK